jgi:hypothetical protein
MTLAGYQAILGDQAHFNFVSILFILTNFIYYFYNFNIFNSSSFFYHYNQNQ